MASISRTGAKLEDLRAMQAAEGSRTFAVCGIWSLLTLRFAQIALPGFRRLIASEAIA
jgi:hypothetical protein